STPTHLAVTDDGHLTWHASTDNVDVDHYVVLREGGTAAGRVTTTSYVDDDQLGSGVYTYTVLAVDEAANSSDESDTATRQVLDTEAPTSPTHLAVTDDGHLTWHASTDNVDVDHYVVLRDGVTIGENVTGTSYADDDDLPPGEYT